VSSAEAARSVRWTLRVAAPLSLLIIWQVAVATRALNPAFFPPPSAIVRSFVAYAASGQLATNTLATLGRIIIGLVLGGIPGTLLGLAMGMSRYVSAYADPIVKLLYPIPKIAILPLLYYIFGAGDGSRWAAVAIGVFFLMTINTEAGVRQIEAIYLDVARAYRTRPWTVFFRILLPGALPNIYAGLKLSIGIAIVLDVAAEYQLTNVGLGYAIFNAGQLLDVERLYAALVAVSLLGFLLSVTADAVERIAIPWRIARRG